MAIIEIARIQVRRGQELPIGKPPQLEPGEFGWAQDTEHLYIGKRISEGAFDDENTRILTENDLNNIFSLFGAANTTTVITPYSYRTGTDHLYLVPGFPSVRTIQSKLDETVSLEDFGVIPSFTGTQITNNITEIFNIAVDTLFNNGLWNDEEEQSLERKDSRRKLKIPPGHYYIDEYIKLPPYTSLEGEGPELTKITVISTLSGIFKTVDSNGNDFESGLMVSGVKRARQVSIKGMTLEYDPFYASDNPLVSVDNVLDFSIENCILRTTPNTDTTSTYGYVSSGIGIGIRGTGSQTGFGSGDANLCENIRIHNCKLDSLYVGVQATGTVIRPVITDCVFGFIDRGIKFYPVDSLIGPSNGIIKNNRFENILRESIFVDGNAGLRRSNHLSENNFFIQTGNGVDSSDFITTSTTATPIIRFNSQGNKSINDYFHRRTVANQTTDPDFYYAPLVAGSAQVDTVEIITATVVSSATTAITKLPLTGENQFVSIRYQLYNSSLSRKGDISVNITPEGYTAITDSYNYVETLEEGSEQPEIYFDTNDSNALLKNYLSLICINNSTQLTMEYSINILV